MKMIMPFTLYRKLTMLEAERRRHVELWNRQLHQTETKIIYWPSSQCYCRLKFVKYSFENNLFQVSRFLRVNNSSTDILQCFILCKQEEVEKNIFRQQRHRRKLVRISAVQQDYNLTRSWPLVSLTVYINSLWVM